MGTVFWLGLSVLAFWPLVAPRVRYSRLLLLLLMSCVAVSFPITWAGYQDRGWDLHFWLTVALLAMLFGASHAAARWRFGKVVLGLSLCVFAIGWIVVTAIDPIVSPLLKLHRFSADCRLQAKAHPSSSCTAAPRVTPPNG